MAIQIIDGTGSNEAAKVSNGRLFTKTITSTNAHQALEDGNLYNIGTGYITLTSDTASDLMYIKNTGTVDLDIDLYVINTKASTGGSGVCTVEILRNPNAGTLISNGSPISNPMNMNFGASNVLNATVLKGAEGTTLSGHDNELRSKTTADNRLLLGTITDMPQGSSVGIRVTPPSGNTSMDVEVIVELFSDSE